MFEAVARLRSFRKAADELFVTPAAVTHQIKALEDQLGIALFVRLSHGIELTPPAEAALPRLQQGFETVSQAVRELRDFGQSPRLTISVTSTLASRWMVPRLESFLSKHPGVDVRILASRQFVDASAYNHDGEHLAPSQIPDIEIHFSNGPPPGEYVDPLFSVYVVPMCHPRLIEASPPLLTPDDLRHRTLLHGDSSLSDREQSAWAKWLKHAGATKVDARRGLQLDHSTLALEAAADGLGVTLAMPMLASQELAEGKVKILFPIELPITKSYFVATSRTSIHRPEVSAFRNWLLEEARKDGERTASAYASTETDVQTKNIVPKPPAAAKKKAAKKGSPNS